MRAMQFSALALCLGAAMSLALIGCGGGDSKPAAGDGTKTPSDGGKTSSDGGVKPADKTWLKSGTGSLKGKVTLDKGADAKALADGAQKAMETVIDAKGGEVRKQCLEKAPPEEMSQQKWRIAPDGGVKNVLVWLKPVEGFPFLIDDTIPAVKDAKAKELVMDQPHCAYDPHVLFVFPSYKDKDGKKVVTGEKLRIKSTAPFAHNTAIDSPDINFNKSINDKGELVEGIEAKNSAEPILIKCNVHPQMQAWVSYIDNPYFAVTDKDGNFEIKNVPAGKVKIFAWHEGAAGKFLTKKSGDEIELKDGATQNFTLKPE